MGALAALYPFYLLLELPSPSTVAANSRAHPIAALCLSPGENTDVLIVSKQMCEQYERQNRLSEKSYCHNDSELVALVARWGCRWRSYCS